MKRDEFYYGWWIVIAGCVIWVFTSMTNAYGLSVFYKRLIDDFGWTRSQLAGAISLSRLESGFLGPPGGYLVDRFGPRIVMLGGVIMMGVGYLLLARIDSLLQFYLIFIGLVIVGNSLSFMLPLDTTVANWFIKKRGIAFGLLRGAVAVGAAGVPLLAWFISMYGWRTAFVATGVGTIALGVPVAIAMRRRPEDYGLKPDGERPKDLEAPVSGQEGGAGSSPLPPPIAGGAIVDDLGMSAMEALKTYSFWAISMGFSLRLMLTTAVTLHAIPLLEDLGYSKGLAAAILGTIGSVSIIGRLGGGLLCDRMGTKGVTVFTAVTLAIACLVLAYAHNIWLIILFVAIYAPSYGASVAAMPAMRADYFGRRAFGTITGLSGMVQMGGTIMGPIFAAYVFDVTGSYQLAFLILAAILMIAAGFFATLKRPKYS